MNDAEYMNEAAKKYQDLSSRDESFKMYRELFEKGYDELKIGEWLLDNDSIKENKPKYFDRLLKITTDENKIIEWKKKYYNCFLHDPDKYDLTLLQLDRYQEDYEKILSDISILKNLQIDEFSFSIFSNYHHLQNIIYVNKKEVIEKNYQNHIFKKNKLKKIAFIHLPIHKSPVFIAFLEVLYYLSKIDSNIILYLDNHENELNDFQKEMISRLNVKYFGSLNDEDVYNLIINDNIDILLSNYAEYSRRNVLIKKPSKVLIRCVDGISFYPNYFYDLNLNTKRIFTINDKNISTLNLDTQLLTVPLFKKKKNYYEKVVFDYNKIKIGIIGIPRKFDKKTFKMLKEVLKIKNVFLTIYTISEKSWFKKILNYPKNMDIRSYNNCNIMEINDNILFLDTNFYNNHSTALEVISMYRPIIGFYNKNRIFGKFTFDILKYMNMENELIADNVKSYVELVKKYTSDHKNYYQMLKKFLKNIETSKILDMEHYANHLYEKLNEIDIEKIYEKNKINNI